MRFGHFHQGGAGRISFFGHERVHGVPAHFQGSIVANDVNQFLIHRGTIDVFQQIHQPRPQMLILGLIQVAEKHLEGAGVAQLSQRGQHGHDLVFGRVLVLPIIHQGFGPPQVFGFAVASETHLWAGFLVRDAYFQLECELEEVKDGYGPNSLIIGRVVEAHASPEALRVTDRDDGDVTAEAPLMAYVSPGRYARVQETYAFPFPEGFTQ